MHDIGYYIVGGLGLLAWVAVIWMIFGRRSRGRSSDAEIQASQAQVLERLAAIDARVATIEKTLSEIP